MDRTLRLALDVSSLTFPELLVAPDDDEEVLQEARRRDMLKDNMIMFYRELYKAQMQDYPASSSFSDSDTSCVQQHPDSGKHKTCELEKSA